MKKILCVALALVMALGIGAVAFASTDNLSLGGTDGSANVHAKRIRNLSAQVTWEDMYFVYDSGLRTWTNTNSSGTTLSSGEGNNDIVVANLSGVAISTKARYEAGTKTGGGSYGAYSPVWYADETLSYYNGASSGTAISTTNEYTHIADSIAAYTGTNTFYFMFTDLSASDVPSDNFAIVGALKIQIGEAVA